MATPQIRIRKLCAKLTLYKVYILPHFTYCSIVWMHCGKTASDKLEKLNKQALRLIFKVARYSFSGSIPPKFDHKLRRQKQSFGKIATTSRES